MNSQINIFVLDNKFVHIGKGKKVQDPLLGDAIQILHCYNIERWGTTEGLGQLAIEGKQDDTRLRYNGISTVPTNRIVFTIAVTPEAAKTFGYEDETI